MKHFLLFYSFVDGYLEKRPPLRDAHLRHAWNAQSAGVLTLAGALSDPADGAVLVFKANSPDVANEFAVKDPYVVNGLVTSWQVREWATVVGDDALTPVRPEDGAEHSASH